MKREKLSLFFFIDAFGDALLQRHPDFLKGLIRDSRPLETILGYSSACDPSIISGLLPCEHRMWSSFYYDPDHCPYRWLRHLEILPDAVFRRGRVRHWMSRGIKKIHGFTGYFQLYAVPFKYLPLFNYAEQKRIWEPGGLLRGTSIFDLLHEHGIPHYVHDSGLPDDTRLARLRQRVDAAEIDFAYISLGGLDALMHAVGPHDPRVDEKIDYYDRRFRELLDLALDRYEQINWYVFTDHGMHPVTGARDLMAQVEALGLQWNRDYVAFYDSTMLRLWILDEKARAPLTHLLGNHPDGRLLPPEELKALGVWFEDGMYGDLIFLMNSGLQIAPSFMGVKPCKGMHGYHPQDADSRAVISSNRELPAGLHSIHQIFELMLNELNLTPFP